MPVTPWWQNTELRDQYEIGSMRLISSPRNRQSPFIRAYGVENAIAIVEECSSDHRGLPWGTPGVIAPAGRPNGFETGLSKGGRVKWDPAGSALCSGRRARRPTPTSPCHHHLWSRGSCPPRSSARE